MPIASQMMDTLSKGSTSNAGNTLRSGPDTRAFERESWLGNTDGGAVYPRLRLDLWLH